MVTEEEGIQIKTLGKILRRVSPVYALAREDGIYTMDFLNEPDGYADFTAEDINEILMNHSYYGWTRIGTELKSKVLSENVHDNMKKPLLVLTITGGDVKHYPFNILLMTKLSISLYRSRESGMVLLNQ